MKLLLDTHILVWSLTKDRRLNRPIIYSIESLENSCYVSIASLWEIGIKYSLGKIELKVSLDDFFELISKTGFEILPISPEHILQVSTLPLHHRDPFDRLIIAQAIHDKLVLITRDSEIIKNYEVEYLSA